MRLRLFCILLATLVSGTRGWGYCECWGRRQVGLGPGIQSLQGGSHTALRLGGRRSIPASARLLAPIFPCLSPALRNAALRLLRAPGAGAGLRAEDGVSPFGGFGAGIQAGAGAWV